ncbi:hypothetical protein [Bradyrhizobium diversitatis]|uniref:Transposase n=1 Tax=Bradyrhizobium diversitatis TaxID=2755406 RepID=A0ABS0PBS8_9BRAD|nr:hypothetical protein [Bradyrhizobium diversitatis]MBH5390638.1 hypothetical protein [Bradyrhizobium diversitatis]
MLRFSGERWLVSVVENTAKRMREKQPGQSLKVAVNFELITGQLGQGERWYKLLATACAKAHGHNAKNTRKRIAHGVSAVKDHRQCPDPSMGVVC